MNLHFLLLEIFGDYVTILVYSVLCALVNAQLRSGSPGSVVMKAGGCFPGE
jgi:hypothetical protein